MFVWVTSAESLAVRPSLQILLTAGAPEDHQKEGPKGRYAGRDYDNVAFIAAKGLVSLICRKPWPTHAFHIQSVTVITKSCLSANFSANKEMLARLQVMSARESSSGILEVLMHADMQALRFANQRWFTDS